MPHKATQEVESKEPSTSTDVVDDEEENDDDSNDEDDDDVINWQLHTCVPALNFILHKYFVSPFID